MIGSQSVSFKRSFAPSLPESLHLDDVIGISEETLREAITRCQQLRIPHLCLAIIESEETRKYIEDDHPLEPGMLASDSASIGYQSLDVSVDESDSTTPRHGKYYHICDGSYIFRDTFSKISQKITLLNPFNNLPIQNIHFFVLDCFCLDESEALQPVSIKAENFHFYPLNIPYPLDLTAEMEVALFDGLNLHVDESSVETMHKTRRIQRIMEDAIRRGYFFSELEPKQRESIARIWKGCAEAAISHNKT